MITTKDMRFHPPEDPDNFLWSETNYFSFNIPEEKINGTVYMLARPTLGVCASHIIAWQGITKNAQDVLYSDLRAHLPIPKGQDLNDYHLANDLHVKVLDSNGGKRDYQMDYVGYDDSELHLTFRGLMEPYDIHDPSMDPMTETGDATWSEAYKYGHFDMTAHITGECRLHGKIYKVDCASTMDHSWGPRLECNIQNMNWFHPSWGTKRTIHCIFGLDPYGLGAAYGDFMHGYVLEDGEVYGLKGGHGAAKRDGLMPTEMDITVTDIRDKTFHFTGKRIASNEWNAWPGICCYHPLMEWNLDGEIGYGEVQDLISEAYITSGKEVAYG